jgi:acetyl-CoA synthetase (ADP-forming)
VPGREHKTGRGLVQARIGDPASLGRAASAIERAAGPGLRAFLVEEWVDSPRELACGLVRDASFGPCVMAGFGGVHAEIVDDTCFRAAPVSMGDALAMLEELRSRAMLGAYRGGRPADREAIARILVSLGRLGLACPEVSQVDINPLIVRMDGTPVAVDALIVLGD